MQRIGLWLAIAALLVNGPRFVIIFLQVDGLSLPIWLEGGLLAITGIATGLVLTGGGAYAAHVLAQPTHGGTARAFLLLCWILLLVFAVVLLAPMMVAAIRSSELAHVLVTNRDQWVWAVMSIVAVEVLAAAAMAAHALLAVHKPQLTTEQEGAFSVLTRALVKRLETRIALPDQSQVPEQVPVTHNLTPQQEQEEKARPELPVNAEQSTKNGHLSKKDALSHMLTIYQKTPNASLRTVSKHIKRSPQTVANYLTELEAAGRVIVNGTGTVEVVGD
jgi:hypothetical protein